MSKEIPTVKAIYCALASFLFAAFLASTSASAQVRTFVASTGSDSNPCSRSAPCRTFQAAVDAAAPGGEVVALDSAGFGSNVTINKAVSIVAPEGVYAGVTVFSGAGIDIKAGASDTVILRGLTIIEQGVGSYGVIFNSGKTLHIESCVVNGFSTSTPGSEFVGVFFRAPGNLEVKDSIIRGNDIGVEVGVLTATHTGTAVATIDHVRLEGNRDVGLIAVEGSKVTVRDTVASNNFVGFQAESTFVAVQLYIENCVASNNTVGVASLAASSDAVATVTVSNSTVTNNSVGLQADPLAHLFTRGNNTVQGNTTAIIGTISSFSPM
jgi:hypothetical protein